jgi:hypothetical protein
MYRPLQTPEILLRFRFILLLVVLVVTFAYSLYASSKVQVMLYRTP